MIKIPVKVVHEATDTVVHNFDQATHIAQQVSDSAPTIGKATVVLVLGGVSYTLQDINTIISITAGLLGIFYTLHLLGKFWWDNFWKPLLRKEQKNG